MRAWVAARRSPTCWSRFCACARRMPKTWAVGRSSAGCGTWRRAPGRRARYTWPTATASSPASWKHSPRCSESGFRAELLRCWSLHVPVAVAWGTVVVTVPVPAVALWDSTARGRWPRRARRGGRPGWCRFRGRGRRRRSGGGWGGRCRDVNRCSPRAGGRRVAWRLSARTPAAHSPSRATYTHGGEESSTGGVLIAENVEGSTAVLPVICSTHSPKKARSMITAQLRSPARLLVLTSALVVLVVAGCGGSGSSSSSTKPASTSQTSSPSSPSTKPATTPQESSSSGIPQNNEGDHDTDNNGGPSDGDGNL